MTGKRKNTSRGNGCMSNNAFNSWFMVALSFPLHEIVLRNYSNNNMGNQPFLGMPTTSKGFLITSPPPQKKACISASDLQEDIYCSTMATTMSS
jgi:hypothetical protein